MAAVTADISLRIAKLVSHKFILDTSAAQTGYRGEPLIIDQSADTVNVAFVHDTTHPVVAATDAFVGIALEGKTVASASAENYANAGIEAAIEGSIIGFKSAVFTNADIGKTVYYESGALSTTAGDTAMIGKLLFVEDGYCYVGISTAVCSGA